MSNPSFLQVTNPSEMSALLESLELYDSVALDTEADSLHHYFEKVCLIQLSVADVHIIVDPLAGLDLAPLLALLSERALILHGADYDLRMMRMSFGFEPRREVFDTMLAAQLLGYKELGLAALVNRHFGVELPKHGQKADWSQRPLPAKLLEYAYGDTLYLHSLADILREELARQGRLDWHAETCRNMMRTSMEPPRRVPGTEWKIKGSNKLNSAGLALLHAMWTWRDQEAQHADIPPFKVLSNQGLLNLVEWGLAYPHAGLEHWPDLPRGYRGRRLASLRHALHLARTAPVAPPASSDREGRYQQNNRDDKGLIDALRLRRDAIAAELELDSSILAPRAVLTSIARNQPRTLEEMAHKERMLPWQIKLLGEAFLEVLSGYGQGEVEADSEF